MKQTWMVDRKSFEELCGNYAEQHWRPKDLFVEPVDSATLHVMAKLDGKVLYWKIIATCGWLCAAAGLALWRIW